MHKNVTPCPCDSGKSFDKCCGAYLDATEVPMTAEQLMRSRYCAYVMLREDYLLATWHTSTRPQSLNLRHEKQPQWLGLNIVRTHAGTATDAEGRVEFVARYKTSGKAARLHEVSRFVREGIYWYYVDGVIEH